MYTNQLTCNKHILLQKTFTAAVWQTFTIFLLMQHILHDFVFVIACHFLFEAQTCVTCIPDATTGLHLFPKHIRNEGIP